MLSRIHKAIAALSESPRPAGCKKLVGEDNLWRIRIGDYRVIYTIDDAARSVTILVVAHRSEAYN